MSNGSVSTAVMTARCGGALVPVHHLDVLGGTTAHRGTNRVTCREVVAVEQHIHLVRRGRAAGDSVAISFEAVMPPMLPVAHEPRAVAGGARVPEALDVL